MFFFTWLFSLLGKIGIKYSKKTPLARTSKEVSREKGRTDKKDAEISDELSTGQLDKWRNKIIKNIKKIDDALDGMETKAELIVKGENKIARGELKILEAEMKAEALVEKNINKAESQTQHAEHDLDKVKHQLHRLMRIEEHELEVLEGDIIEFIAYLLFAGDVAKECAKEQPRIGEEFDKIEKEFIKFEADFMYSSGHKHEKRRIVKPWKKKGTDSSGFCDLIISILTKEDTEAFKAKYKDQAVKMLTQLDDELAESLEGKSKLSMKRIQELEEESEDDKVAQAVIDESTLVEEGVENQDEAKDHLDKIEDEAAEEEAESGDEDDGKDEEPEDDNLGAAAENLLEKQLEGD